MHVEIWDTVFVRVRRRDIHPVLRDVAGYAVWWPGLRASPTARGTLLAFRAPGFVGVGTGHAFELRVTKERPDSKGLRFATSGHFTGEGEWYYMDEAAGTVVNYLLHAEVTARGWRRLVTAHRASVRTALHVLKDRLEGGRVPGAEPDPELVAHQRKAATELLSPTERAAAGLPPSPPPAEASAPEGATVPRADAR